jgi:hypothetical protein
MELEILLLFSQKPTIEPYFDLVEFSPILKP